MPKTQRLSDAALVRRSQQGDRRAFAALVSRYDRRLRGLTYALLLDRGQMDAALALAYMRSWRDVVRINPRDDVGPWLYRAVYNACIDQLRRNEAPGGVRPAPVDVPPGVPGGLRAVLGTLAPADRVAVVLVEREGFTVTSAARILGVTPDELETRLDVVRDRLAPYVPVPPQADEAIGAEETVGAEETDAEEVPEVVEAEAAEGAEQGAAAAPAPVPGDGEQPAPAGASGNGDEGATGEPAAEEEADVGASGDGGTPSANVPGPDRGASAEDEATEERPPAPAAATTRANGHATRGRGRRARRRANGAERRANGADPPATTPARAEDEAEPPNGETAADPAQPADAADGSDSARGDDGAAPTDAAAAPSADEHEAADRVTRGVSGSP